MTVPIMEVEWLVTRESFSASFVSLAVKGSKLETEIMEDLAFWLSVSGCLRGWDQRVRQVAGARPPGRGGRAWTIQCCRGRANAGGSLWFGWSDRDPESRRLRR